VTIVNDTSSGINKLKASLNDAARSVIYDRHVFIIQATDRCQKTSTDHRYCVLRTQVCRGWKTRQDRASPGYSSLKFSTFYCSKKFQNSILHSHKAN